MIATDARVGLLVRAATPLVYRDAARTAEKLRDFAATEAGSALDMLRAAELCDDPALRRLFLRHGLDEARHAHLFAQEADRLEAIAPSTRSNARRRSGAYRSVHAVRQDLFERLGLLAFVVFVHQAERRGQAHFAALLQHFEGDARLASLFAGIERDERFHVAYTGKLLERWRQEGRGRELWRARWKIRTQGSWAQWRRLGRQLGDHAARLFLAVLYATLVPPFALLQQRLDPSRPGWRERKPSKQAPSQRAPGTGDATSAAAAPFDTSSLWRQS